MNLFTSSFTCVIFALSFKNSAVCSRVFPRAWKRDWISRVTAPCKGRLTFRTRCSHDNFMAKLKILANLSKGHVCSPFLRLSPLTHSSPRSFFALYLYHQQHQHFWSVFLLRICYQHITSSFKLLFTTLLFTRENIDHASRSSNTLRARFTWRARLYGSAAAIVCSRNHVRDIGHEFGNTRSRASKLRLVSIVLRCGSRKLHTRTHIRG